MRTLPAATVLILAAASVGRADIAVTVTVDPTTDHRPISPWIYGTNQDITGVPFTSYRQGGNRMTGYNWENNASNAGEDYFHQSDNFLTWHAGIPPAQENIPGIVVTHFHDQAMARGADYSLVTLQLAGYVSRDKSGVVSPAQAAPSLRWDAVNFAKPTALSTTPDTADGTVYMDEFMHFLVSRYGGASTATGVRGYSLDNEPDLWSHTHPRIHPGARTCADLIARNIEAARAVKRIDPAAETVGFVSYGFNGYHSYQDAPDWPTERTKGDYRWFVDYYLDQMKKASDTEGRRLLDVLDLHNYSEATGGGQRVNAPSTWENSACNLARMQAPRTYWDPTYTENSWIGQWFPQFLPLLPNIQASIDAFYPGTKLAITEYNFGGESHVSGGIAQADTLGIFGRQGVHLAHWWQLHDNPTYIAAAFRLFLDYDGAGGAFGDISIPASASDRATCSVHAALDSADPTRLHLILINKSADEPAIATIQLGGARAYTSARVFAFDSASPAITERTAVPVITGNTFTCTLPALTAAHLVLASPADAAPTITGQPASVTVTAGGVATFTVTASAAGDTPLGYQWRLDGVAIDGATGATYTLPSAQAFHAGAYSCVVSAGAASATSATAMLTVTPAPASNARLLNLSTRALSLTGDAALIPGFVLSGAGTRTMLIRAAGPQLALPPFNLEGTLADPRVTLTGASGPIATNDDWGIQSDGTLPAAIESVAADVGAFPLAPGGRDAALIRALPAGAYTAVTGGADGGTGIAIVELYDTGGTGPALVNISNRGHVGTGDAVMIPGFVVSAEGSRTFLIRAVGPTLGQPPFGVSGVLADPVLTIFSAGTPILANDDWHTGTGAATTASIAETVGAFALAAGSADAAFVVTLPPGAYTVQATGKSGATGTALVEVYLVP